MVKMSTLRIALIALAALTAKADTVTTRDSSAWNGRVTIAGGVLTLTANFPAGKVVPLHFGANYLRAIEFNTATYNPGAVPTGLLPKPNGGVFRGTIYMQNKAIEKCLKSITVDPPGHVSCDGKAFEGVIRILIHNEQ